VLPMTRFKELARIQAAIRHRNKSELRWAIEYCRMRMRIATGKDDAKYWSGIEREVTNVLGSSSPCATGLGLE